MDVPEYPENNVDRKEETAPKKKVERVVEGDVVRRKKTTSSKMAESFSNVMSYVARDVILPAAKDMLSDAVAQGVDQLLFGESRGRRQRQAKNNGYVSYNRYSTAGKKKDPAPPADRPLSRSARATHDFDEIILSSRIEAEEVLDRLFDLVGRYESATVSDLYELVGIQSKYTDDNWGWLDVRGATVRRVRSGYMLDLPAPEYLD